MGLPVNSGLDLHSRFQHGPLNLITDVEGITVGHKSIRNDAECIHTGVTAIFPHQGNLFLDSVMAGSAVINGFGKSAGILQLQELGAIETPIIMTNTLSVGTATNALVKYMLKQNEDIGATTGTVNCLVTECNDGRLNDIRGLHVTEDDVADAMEAADVTFQEGDVGSGSGMCCLGLKGGIGSSSRVITIDGQEYRVGALVMTNFGEPGNLVIGGKHYKTPGDVGAGLKTPDAEMDKGSIIMLIATDVPLSERQLNRVAKRSMVSLGRTGSICGNGSGDIAIAFTTANRIPHYSDKDILDFKAMYDEHIDPVFQASVEAVEEAIISSLYHASTVEGFMGHKYLGFRDFLEQNENI